MSSIDFTAHEHPVFVVACPACRAKIGRRCMRPSEHRAFTGSKPHRARCDAADRLWLEQGAPFFDASPNGKGVIIREPRNAAERASHAANIAAAELELGVKCRRAA